MAKEVTVKSTAQNFTATWADLGSEINTYNYNTMLLYIDLDINDTLDARIRALAKRTSGGTDEYNLLIKTVGTSDVKLESNYYEWNKDEDNKCVLQITLKQAVPYIQLQIEAGTAGATPGQIDSCYAFLV